MHTGLSPLCSHASMDILMTETDQDTCSSSQPRRQRGGCWASTRDGTVLEIFFGQWFSSLHRRSSLVDIVLLT